MRYDRLIVLAFGRFEIVPKYVDHDQRRLELLDALWRVVERDGAVTLSIRSIAAEAEISKTNVAYYFPSRLAILKAAAEQVSTRVSTELATEFLKDPNVDNAVEALAMTVPTTPVRRRQSEVWLMLLTEGVQSPEAASVLESFNEGLNAYYRQGIQMLIEGGFIDAGVDVDFEATRIQALIDGLSLHTISDPVRTDAALVRKVIATHLHSLAPAKVPGKRS